MDASSILACTFLDPKRRNLPWRPTLSSAMLTTSLDTLQSIPLVPRSVFIAVAIHAFWMVSSKSTQRFIGKFFIPINLSDFRKYISVRRSLKCDSNYISTLDSVDRSFWYLLDLTNVVGRTDLEVIFPSHHPESLPSKVRPGTILTWLKAVNLFSNKNFFIRVESCGLWKSLLAAQYNLRLSPHCFSNGMHRNIVGDLTLSSTGYKVLANLSIRAHLMISSHQWTFHLRLVDAWGSP